MSPMNQPQQGQRGPSQELEISIAQIVTEYVAARAAGLALKPDALLGSGPGGDPQWSVLINEGLAMINVAVFWSKTAAMTWVAAGGPLSQQGQPVPAPTPPPAPTPSPVVPVVNPAVVSMITSAMAAAPKP